MTSTWPLSADEFLAVRHQLAQANNTSKLEQLDGELRDMAASDPDQAAAILEALSRSNDLGAKEAAVIYLRYLLPGCPDRAQELLLTLLFDEDLDIKSRALDAFDQITSDPALTPAQAAQLVVERTRKTPS